MPGEPESEEGRVCAKHKGPGVRVCAQCWTDEIRIEKAKARRRGRRRGRMEKVEWLRRGIEAKRVLGRLDVSLLNEELDRIEDQICAMLGATS